LHNTEVGGPLKNLEKRGKGLEKEEQDVKNYYENEDQQ
jgi:hypothetical protein